MFDLLTVEVHKKSSPSIVASRLVELGYQGVRRVAERGDFCVRGGLVDIFPITHHSPLRVEFSGDSVISVRSFDDQAGHFLASHQRVVILPARCVKPAQIKEAPFGWREIAPIDELRTLEPGDHVVHIQYGIGRFVGWEYLEIERRRVEHLVIRYADNERLYCPVDQAGLLRRYVGVGGRAPKLSRMQGSEWGRMKKKARLAVGHLAEDLLRLEAVRRAKRGFAFGPDGAWQKELEASFEFEETLDQTRSSEEVKRDMERLYPMDRLICGDVGYGKTEVALRAVFKAVESGKQAALLVPTTILAEQHYRTFKKRFAPYPIDVQMLSRFRSSQELKQTVKALDEGSCDVVIGTHRLLSKDIRFRKLGLVVIDEEQRFGVRHKEKLKSFRTVVDVLTLTATPIPRTLYMSLMGIKDFSIVSTPPQNRVPIETHVEPYNDEVVQDAMCRELKRGGQVFFVHNRVEGIENVAERLRKLVPQAKMDICHGQMDEHELEEIILKFMDGKLDVLVATNIIESGLDIPNANTLIVNRADQFGLADLYQLRGRVGRFNRQAYAYFLYPGRQVIPEKGSRRLKAIERFTELGSGFNIAMEDLEIRGAGNILGSEQHGWIIAVGFDLYCQLLKQEVERLKGRGRGRHE
ncbi:MAG: transcription-repair coupling factor [Candidatus Omnitrophica bacterium]|nr:transcription-repair coupling factor [Candidatus Omnitrophota bacterium]